MAIRTVVVKYAADAGSLLRDLDGAAKANERLAGSSEKASKRVDAMAAAGLGLAVAIGAGVARFAEFDATMSQVAAATGETAAGMAQLRDVAIKAGADTQYSANEAAQGITELAKAGVSAQEIIGGGLTGALNLAAAGQIEVADAAEIAATAMTQFELKGGQVSHVADLLAAGANKAQGGVGDLGMALKQSGLVASQTGLTIEETTAGLTAFASAGLLGSDAGTSFKSMLQRLTPQSEEAANLMDKLGISAYDASGNFIGLENLAGNLQTSLKNLTPEQRNAAMAVIFGSDAVRAAAILYKEGAEGIREWTEETDQAGYAAEQAAKLTDNLKGDLERLGGSIDTVLIQSGSGANTTLRMLVQTGEDLVDIIGQIPGPVIIGAAAFGTLALVGPKISSLTKTVTGPLTTGVGRFRDEMRLAQAAAIGYGPAIDGAATKSLTAAQKMKTAAVAARAASGGIKGAASGIVTALGGGWGIALLAATAGVTAFATAQANAKAATEELSDTIDKQTGAWTGASREFVLKAMLDDLDPEAVALLGQLGVNLGDAAQAALDGGPKLAAYQQYLKGLAGAARDLPGADYVALNAIDGLSSSIGNQNEVAQNAIIIAKARADANVEAANREAVANSNMAGSANAAERGFVDMGTAADGATDALDSAQKPTDEMNTLLGRLGAKSKEASDELKELDRAIDLLGGGTRALQAAEDQQAAAIDKVREAAQKRAEAATGGKGSDAANRALDKALLQRTQAQERLNAVEAKGTKATESQRIAARQALARAEQAVSQAQERVAKSTKSAAEVAKDKAEADRAYREALRGVAEDTLDRIKVQKDENQSVEELRKTYEIGRAEVERQLKLSGLRGKALQDETDKIMGTKGDFQALLDVYAKTPGQVLTDVKATGTQKAIADVKAVWEVIDGRPKVVGIEINVSSNVHAAIAGIANALGPIGAPFRILGAIPNVPNAAGNIYKAYAAGGVESHVAQIAPGNVVRIWGEPETGGESYIPHANDWRRPRAKAILKQTADILGMKVVPNATGNIYGSAGRPVAGVPPRFGHVINEGRLAKAIADAIPPQLPPIFSGDDAYTAARKAYRDEWRRRDG